MPNIIKPKVAKRPPKKFIQRSKKTSKKSLLAVRPTPKSPKTSTPDYYNCLMNYAQQGFYDVQENKKLKTHSCCKKCKLSAPSLNNQREKELVKFITSYKQMGESFAKLLKPLN
jgi:hypothetical protein